MGYMTFYTYGSLIAIPFFINAIFHQCVITEQNSVIGRPIVAIIIREPESKAAIMQRGIWKMYQYIYIYIYICVFVMGTYLDFYDSNSTPILLKKISDSDSCKR